MDERGLIGLDWGTSSLRAYRLAADGVVIERRERASGILQVKDGAFAEALQEIAGDWLADQPRAPLLACGMIGSRQGWREVPYVPCPAGLEELSQGLGEVEATPEGRVMRMVPGLTFRDRSSGLPDVMRGEETQALGALAIAGGEAAVLVMPGTHSKWVRLESGRITGFRTYMTGELFAVLEQHSILGRLMREGGHDRDTFARGLEEGGGRGRDHEAGDLLHLVFTARTLGLLGDMPDTGLRSYLSGLLIGAEIESGRRWAGQPGLPVTVIGAEALSALYLGGLERLGLGPAVAGAPDLAAAGLHAVAGAAGLGEQR